MNAPGAARDGAGAGGPAAGRPAFLHLPDLAAKRLGGMVLVANDEFFGPKENLIEPRDPVFHPERYTDRGKEMDGWETRRRRTPGHDWAVVRLGVPGVVRGVVVDTSFFQGNFPERCSVEATVADDAAALSGGCEWVELFPESALLGDSQNAFEVGASVRATHVRLNILPDGGVARLRVHGEPLPDLRAAAGPVGADSVLDLAAAVNGGLVVGASDRFFARPENLIAPGDSHGMQDGWETRRRRGPGHDWAVIRLAAPGSVQRFEADTTNFKGNYPEACSIDVVEGPAEASVEDLEAVGWREVVPRSPLGPHARHAFDLDRPRAATHVRLNIHPDGGVARFRVRARVTEEGWRAFGIRFLNAQPRPVAERDLLACCGSRTWAARMAAARPFADAEAVAKAADEVWASLGPDDWREAFAAHPRIGERGADAHTRWSREESAGAMAASEETLRLLEGQNREYEARFGHVFLINATGLTAEEMLEALRARLANDPETELREAAEQQRQIARLRLEKLMRP